MLKVTCFTFICVLISHGECAQFKQEMAKILYANPKYQKDLTILTYRVNRKSSYLTSVNVTILAPLGNNVTWRFELLTQKVLFLSFDLKTCEALKVDWIKQWLAAYSNVDVGECPMIPKFYYMSRFEFPPKNFPFQFQNMDYIVKLTVFVTTTKEPIAELSLNLRYK